MNEGAAVLLNPFDETSTGKLGFQFAGLGLGRTVTNRAAGNQIKKAWLEIENDVTSTPLGERYAKLLKAIDKLKVLDCNWDSYDAEPPTHQALLGASDA